MNSQSTPAATHPDGASTDVQLHALEERFALLMRATNDGLWDWDLTTGEVVFSDRWKAQLGYAPGEISSSLDEWRTRIHPDDLAPALETVRTCLNGTRDTYQLEHRLRHRDDTWRWFCARGAVKRDENGIAIRLAGSQQDIHDRKIAEQELRESQRVLTTLFSSLPVMIYQCGDHDAWHFYFVSQGALTITGHDKRAFLPGGSQSYLDIIHRDDRDYVMQEIAQASTCAGSYQITYRITTADGDLKWVWDDGHFLTDSSDSRTLREGFIFDITDRMTAYDQLEQRVEARTRELSTLLDISRGLISTIELEPLLEVILAHIADIVENEAASISMIEDGYVGAIAIRRLPTAIPVSDLVQHRFRLPAESHLWQRVLAGDIVIIDDVRGDSTFARDYRETVGTFLDTQYQHVTSWMAVPLVLKDQVIGTIVLSSSRPARYTEHDGQLVMSLGHFAAIAIENARLHEQARAMAALEERQRLARELHDSVSQALYGIALGAETARAMLERSPEKAGKPIDYIELRPESLEREGLVAALGKQTLAIEARHGIAVRAALCAEPDVSLQTKEAIYRIAQEAMHNTVKHSHATQIHLTLEHHDEHVRLEVRDNGRGFDVSATFPGHLGLISMRERAMRGNGTFQIKSDPNHGTHIVVEIPT